MSKIKEHSMVKVIDKDSEDYGLNGIAYATKDPKTFCVNFFVKEDEDEMSRYTIKQLQFIKQM